MNAITSYDLRHLGFIRIAPPPALSAYIECYWAIQGIYKDGLEFSEKLYPDGGSGILFNFGSAYRINDQRISSPVMYQGSDDSIDTISLSGTVEAIGVRFRPAGAYRILGGLPASELSRCWQPLENLTDLPIHKLWEPLATLNNLAGKLKLISLWLQRRIDAFQSTKSSVLPFVAALAPTIGPGSIPNLVLNSGFSRRKLERLFALQVGIAPARLSQLLKVSYAREQLKTDFTTPLIYISASSGFYDQAHFTRQFKHIMLTTPGQYRQRKMAQVYNT